MTVHPPNTELPVNEAPHRLIRACSFGPGAVVRSFTNLYECAIGAETQVGTFVEIQAGVTIGSHCKVQSHSFVCEGVRIGDGVFVGHGVMFINDKRPRARNDRGELASAGNWVLLPISVETNATIGSGACILGGVTLGRACTIGAGAVVTRDVGAGETVAGNPARPLPLRGGESSAANA